MKALTVAGVRFVVPGYVAIFEVDDARPVYHDPNGWSGDRGDAYIRQTACGRTIIVSPHGREGYERNAIEIPTRHAIRFARPCLRCWPQLRGRPEIELKAGRL